MCCRVCAERPLTAHTRDAHATQPAALLDGKPIQANQREFLHRFADRKRNVQCVRCDSVLTRRAAGWLVGRSLAFTKTKGQPRREERVSVDAAFLPTQEQSHGMPSLACSLARSLVCAAITYACLDQQATQ